MANEELKVTSVLRRTDVWFLSERRNAGNCWEIQPVSLVVNDGD